MVAKRRRKTKAAPLRQIVDGLAVIARMEIVGLSLVLISVFTLLSLLTGSRGSLTGLWIDFLRAATGDGVAGVPLLTGFLGLWMVLRVIARSGRRAAAARAMPILSWREPTGLLLFFLAYIAAITLLLPPMTRAARILDGRAGGALGLFFANLLEDSLPIWGAWAVIAFSALLGLALIAGRWLWDVLCSMALDGWSLLWQSRRDGPQNAPAGSRSAASDAISEKAAFSSRAGAGARPQAVPLFPSDPHAVPAAPDDEDAPQPDALFVPGRQESMISADERLKNQNGKTEPTWALPQLSDILDFWDRSIDSDDLIRYRGRLLEETLALFGVPADFEGVNAGPTVTQYLIRPGYIERTVRGETKRTKVKVSKIASLTNDLALALAARNVRIEAPIPGTSYVGIEVPNSESNNVGLKELMESEEFELVQARGRLAIALGEDVRGKPVITDLARMPHLLIAGATGTGKSVCINSIIGCLLLTHTPETLRLLMIDPKMVELTVYNGAPHLLSPVVTDVDRAAGVLHWCIKEMERRYQLLNKAGVRDLDRFNADRRKRGEEILPYIIVIIDEMADLMMAAPEEVEKHVIRLAQMARAVGIHLIIATQRPSVDVITGLIKANFPARIAFAVTSQIDSRVVLDVPGAENLLGRGDMLFMAPDSSKLKRLQGAFLDDPEIGRIVQYWQNFHKLETYIQPQPPGLKNGNEEAPQHPPVPEDGREEGAPTRSGRDRDALPLLELEDEGIRLHGHGPMQADDARDALFDEAVQVVTEADRGSVTILQRKLRVGYNRASRLVEQLEAAGVLGPDRGRSQGREVYVQTLEEGGPENVPKQEETPSLSRRNGEDALRRTGDAVNEDAVNEDAVNEDVSGNERAALPPPPEEDDMPPRVWM